MATSTDRLMGSPGPTALMTLVSAGSVAGRVQVVVVPDRLASDRFASSFVNALGEVWPTTPTLEVVDPMGADGDVLAHLADAMALSPEAVAGGESGLARSFLAETLGGTRWVIPTWCVADSQRTLGRFVEQVASQMLAEGLTGCASLILLDRRGDLEVLPQARVNIDARWWWRVVHRLDTEVCVWRETQLFPADDVRRAVVCEVAGWDLDVIPWLLERWDGDDPDDLADSLEEYRIEVHGSDALDRVQGDARLKEVLVGAMGRRSASDEPPKHMEEAWAAGLVQRWDGVTRVAPWLLPSLPNSQRYLERLVWGGQVRALMPRLDFLREKAETRLRQHIDDAELQEWLSENWNQGKQSAMRIDSDDALEANVLEELIKHHPLLKDLKHGNLHKLLTWIRHTRNDLAHLRSLRATDIAKGAQKEEDAFDD